MARSLSFLFVLASLAIFALLDGVDSFTTTASTRSARSSLSSLYSTAATETANTNQNQNIIVEVVEGGEDCDRVLDVATFRNAMKNPQMMMENAQAKRDAIDNTKAALDGLKIGLGLVGPAIAAFTYAETNDITQTATSYAMIGGGVGGLLAVNNYMGKGVHVPDIPEATNRIIVDFSEGLLRKQDVGFVAVNNDDSTFAPARGVLAAVDVQLRNSEKSHPGVRQVANLPSHLHIKNMEVHKSRRRQGVGNALIDEIISYAKSKTDAKALTL